uniref:HTH CENPB-type domain-containing protein n=1 Tax=Latimeria chalumnae TaxID=7897 RepID=H3A0Z6_LATCH
SSLSAWIKYGDKIKLVYENQIFGYARKRMRMAKHPDVEEALFLWFKNARAQDVPVSGPILQIKTEKLATGLGHTDFKCSNGWLDRFKERHSITFHAVCGEASSVKSSGQLQVWRGTTLPRVLQQYSSENVYNADESGIFYRLLPTSLVLKGETCNGGKRSKDRISVLPCANMTGSDKLPMLVIGKSNKPRCFKGMKSLPTEYTANQKTWMISDIFSNQVKKHKKFKRQKCKVAIIIHNCPAYPIVQSLEAIEMIFLLPNTTSRTQPMDQGFIQSLKVYYQTHLIQKLIMCVEKKEELSIRVLDALHMLQYAWSKVIPTTITSCFRHAVFTASASTQNKEEEEDEDDLHLAELLHWAAATGVDFGGATFEEFVAVSDSVVITESLTSNDTTEQVTTKLQDEESEGEDDNDTKLPSHTTAMEMYTVLCHYLQAQNSTHGIFTHLSAMDDFTSSQQCSVKKQKLVTDFIILYY